MLILNIMRQFLKTKVLKAKALFFVMLTLGSANFIQICLAVPCEIASAIGEETCGNEATSICMAFGNRYFACDTHKKCGKTCEPIPPEESTVRPSKRTRSPEQPGQQRFVGMMPGLTNSGTDCFALSTLQAEFASPGFTEVIRSRCSCEKSAFVEATQRFHSKTMGSHEAIVNPVDFIKTIRENLFPYESPRRQLDSAECLVKVIDQLSDPLVVFDQATHAPCEPSRAEPLKHEPGCERSQLLTKLYTLILQKKGTCGTCTVENVRAPESFGVLTLPIAHVTNLDEALDAYFADGACSVCNASMTMTTQISKFPKRLLLSLNRFSFSERGKKISTPIPFPLKLTTLAHQRTNYTLQSFHAHIGTTLSLGHYLAFVQSPDGRWFEYNDDFVRPVPQKEINQILETGLVPAYKGPGKHRSEGTPYVLCYEIME